MLFSQVPSVCFRMGLMHTCLVWCIFIRYTLQAQHPSGYSRVQQHRWCLPYRQRTIQHGRHFGIRRFRFSYDRPLNFMQEFALPNIEKDQETCVVVTAEGWRQRMLLESKEWRLGHQLDILHCTHRPVEGISTLDINSVQVEQCIVK